MADGTLTFGNSTAFDHSTEIETNPSGTADGLYAVLAIRTQTPAWLDECVKRISRLSELNANWNSYGGRAVNPLSVDLAKQLVRYLGNVNGVQCPRVAASPDGNAALSWEWHEHSRELELEVLSSGAMRYSYVDEEDPSQDDEGEANDARVIAQLLTQW